MDGSLKFFLLPDRGIWLTEVSEHSRAFTRAGYDPSGFSFQIRLSAPEIKIPAAQTISAVEERTRLNNDPLLVRYHAKRAVYEAYLRRRYPIAAHFVRTRRFRLSALMAHRTLEFMAPSGAPALVMHNVLPEDMPGLLARLLADTAVDNHPLIVKRHHAFQNPLSIVAPPECWRF